MTQMDFNPPKKGSRGGDNFKKLLGAGGAAVLVVVALAVAWVGLEVFQKLRQSTENAEQSRIPWRTVTEGKAEAKRDGKLILYDFTAAWCGPCKMLDVNVFADERVAALINEQFVPIRVMDRRQEEGTNPLAIDAVQEHFSVRGFPTVIVASAEGTEYSRFEGFRDKSHVQAWLDQVLAGQKQRVKDSTSK